SRAGSSTRPPAPPRPTTAAPPDPEPPPACPSSPPWPSCCVVAAPEARSGPFDQAAADDQSLDLAAAFVNAGDARVAVKALDGVLPAVAVAAVELEHPVDGAAQGLG